MQKNSQKLKSIFYLLKIAWNGIFQFQDIFDEDSFYYFAAAFTVLTFLVTFVASRHFKIKAKEWNFIWILT